MTITDNCAAGRGMSRTCNNQSYIHDNSHGDRVYGKTTEHSKSRPANTPNYRKHCLSDLVLHYLSRIFECKQKCRIKPPRYRLVASSQVIDNASPPIMSKEPEQKQIDTRIARPIKPNRVYKPVFSKGREKRSFQHSTSNRVIWGPFIKKKDGKRS